MDLILILIIELIVLIVFICSSLESFKLLKNSLSCTPLKVAISIKKLRVDLLAFFVRFSTFFP
jgi:hypothetical protein